MPLLLQTIDKIARDKGWDVLYIYFDRDVFPDNEYENWGVRKKLLRWFADNGIAVVPCGPMASENGFEVYCGQLYIDVPFNESREDYQKVCKQLENANGSMRIPGVHFCYLSLDVAMKNKHHDEPGFWDRWADEF